MNLLLSQLIMIWNSMIFLCIQMALYHSFYGKIYPWENAVNGNSLPSQILFQRFNFIKTKCFKNISIGFKTLSFYNILLLFSIFLFVIICKLFIYSCFSSNVLYVYFIFIFLISIFIECIWFMYFFLNAILRTKKMRNIKVKIN